MPHFIIQRCHKFQQLNYMYYLHFAFPCVPAPEGEIVKSKQGIFSHFRLCVKDCDICVSKVVYISGKVIHQWLCVQDRVLCQKLYMCMYVTDKGTQQRFVSEVQLCAKGYATKLC